MTTKPTCLQQINLGNPIRTGSLSAVVDGDQRLYGCMGSSNAWITGGPIITGLQVKSVPLVAGNLTPDQIVGGYISFPNNVGGAVAFALPTGEAILDYITRQQFQSDPTTINQIAATTSLALSGSPAQSFTCTFVTGTGTAPTLTWGTSIAFYGNGASNAVVASPLQLGVSSVTELTFFPITTTFGAVVMGMVPTGTSTGGGGGAQSWAATLVAGKTSGGTNPTISSGDRIQYAVGVAIGAGGVSTGTVAADGVAIGSGAAALGSASVAIGTNSSSGGTGDVTMAGGTTSNGGTSVAIGLSSSCTAVNGTALGGGSTATGTGATAIGQAAKANGTSTAALGIGADTG